MVNDLWNCPRCGRQFPKRNQWHSCTSVPIADHFKDRPARLKEVFISLLQEVEQCGPVRVDAVKSSINLVSRYHFAAVYVQKNSLKLEFVLDRALDDERILRTQPIGEGVFSNFVNMTRIEDIDEQLLDWLAQAYTFRS